MNVTYLIGRIYLFHGYKNFLQKGNYELQHCITEEVKHTII